MNAPGLSEQETRLIAAVFRRHPAITEARLFGSRAKGNHQPHSDVDIAVWGAVPPLEGSAIAEELDELPLPYRFEVQAFDQITHQDLREHIQRLGIPIYPEPARG